MQDIVPLEQLETTRPQVIDSTSSGGYSSSKNVWSDRAQRGYIERAGTHTAQTGDNANERGLIDQTAAGEPIGDELQDAKQGRDNILS
ncbi:hypothetical protein BDQ17DRAFT_1356317 [Cyathus striatus]|nr:hypothetical protein BDQ17DRAFT_1356317 [Cyathus striatus]